MKDSPVVQAVADLQLKADRDQRTVGYLFAAIAYIKHRAASDLPELEAPNGNRLQHIYAICDKVMGNQGGGKACPMEVSFAMAQALRSLLHNSQQHKCATGCHIEKAREILAMHDSIMKGE